MNADQGSLIKAVLHRRYFVAAAALASATVLALFAVAWGRTGADLDELVTAFLEQEKIPGAVIAIGAIGSAPQLRAYGYADLKTARRMAVGDRFRVASLSKPLTAAAVLELVRQGRISLDDRLPALLPEVRNAADPRYATISVRDLLRHSGGWDRDASFDPVANPEATRRELNQIAPASCRSITQAMMERPLDFAPGERFAYSNLGYCWLEQIIERVDGDSYEAAVHALVLNDMNIKSMHIVSDMSGEDSTVAHYRRNRNGPPPQRFHGPPDWFRVLGAAGGWVASAEDLFRFASRPIDPAATERPPYISRDDDYYGLGWHVWPGRDGPTLTHYGSLPGVFSFIIRQPNGLVIVALFNARPANDLQSFRTFLATLPAAIERG